MRARDGTLYPWVRQVDRTVPVRPLAIAMRMWDVEGCGVFLWVVICRVWGAQGLRARDGTRYLRVRQVDRERFLSTDMKMFWKIILRLLSVLLLLVLVAAVTLGFFWRQFHPAVDRTDGVVYGQRHDKDLTMDIIRPVKGANGYGVALMVSGGWKSGNPGDSPTWLMAPLLIRGYTIFAICHISQPDSTVMEIIDDMHRGIRFVRHHADKYGIDPDRIGVTGGSAGGHLSLMLATTGGPGDPNASDPIDRESSAVQAVAIFYPVTDLLNLGASTENPGDGGPPKSFVKAFGPNSTHF